MSLGEDGQPGNRPPGLDRPSDVVLFDVMDTLVYDPFREMPAFFGLSWQDLATGRNPGGWRAFERDESDEHTFLSTFFADGRPFDHEGFLALFRDGYRWLPGMQDLLQDLKDRGCEMHVLSNYPRWYLRIEEKLALSRYLPWTFVSCLTGARKPDARAFLGAAEALGRPPGDFVLVDNSRPNCEGAEAVGMAALLFEGAEPLREALSARALL